MIAGDLLGERARLTPTKTTLVKVQSGRRFTYRDLSSEGWLHTSNLAHREGFYYIDGRIKDMFITGVASPYIPPKSKIFSSSIPPSTMRPWSASPDPKWGESSVAFVVARTEPSETEILDFLETRPARYKVAPRHLLSRSLPRTPYGKVIQPELRKWALSLGVTDDALVKYRRTNRPLALLGARAKINSEVKVCFPRG